MSTITCALCNRPPMGNEIAHKKCRSCQWACYCSRRCQKADWDIHKLICNQFKETTHQAPSASHRLAIFLPVHEITPKVFWLKISKSGEMSPNHDGFRDLGFGDPELERLIGGTVIGMGHRRQQINGYLQSKYPGLQRFALDHKLDLWRVNTILDNNLISNQCILSLANGSTRFGLKGSFVFLSQARMPHTPAASYQNITPGDFRALVDYLRGDFLTWKPDYKNTVTGVEISSDGDQYFTNRLQYVEVELRKSHRIFKNTKPTQISVQLGLPLLIRRNVRPPPSREQEELGERNGITLSRNLPACVLLLKSNPAEIEWGYPDVNNWDLGLGTVLVVRQDMLDLKAQHVEALTDFCSEEVFLRMLHLSRSIFATVGTDRDGIVKIREEFVEKEICGEKFEMFWEELVEQKKEAGDDAWTDINSPYHQPDPMAFIWSSPEFQKAVIMAVVIGLYIMISTLYAKVLWIASKLEQLLS